MASDQEVAALRVLTDEVDSPTYTDEVLSDMIDTYGMNGSARNIWCGKAASYSTAVDITEAGSSRKNSDLFKNAQGLCTYYTGLAAEDALAEVPGEAGIDWPVTRAIVRP